MGLLDAPKFYECNPIPALPKVMAEGRIYQWEYSVLLQAQKNGFYEVFVILINNDIRKNGIPLMKSGKFPTDISIDNSFEKSCEEFMDEEINDMVKKVINKV